ncbi:Disulfide-bond oxidoreductase YfcG [Apiospora phragmitis]|uniref:Disulfide-bond oxidoreductase YfcG n=1 Tax=Apiospora phragmitis TaxID=2905665 RepID=A0ABR1VG50_9PEZI
MAPSDITLYTVRTPNGIKASIALEELGLEYKTHAISFAKNEQKEPWFLEINPNGRIPAITDKFEDGKPIHISESGSILQYLVDRYDTEHKISYPRGTRKYYEINNWIMWQMGGLGPMQGQANHFFRYAPEKIQYGIDRYQNETRRLYRVMDTHLAKSKSGYLVGDRCTIADISCWGWVKAGLLTLCNQQHGPVLTWTSSPALKAWMEKLRARPAFEKGADVPPATEEEKRPKTKEEEEKYAAEARKWIMQGQQEEAKK